jgi:hypothetical protein
MRRAGGRLPCLGSEGGEGGAGAGFGLGVVFAAVGHREAFFEFGAGADFVAGGGEGEAEFEVVVEFAGLEGDGAAKMMDGFGGCGRRQPAVNQANKKAGGGAQRGDFECQRPMTWWAQA